MSTQANSATPSPHSQRQLDRQLRETELHANGIGWLGGHLQQFRDQLDFALDTPGLARTHRAHLNAWIEKLTDVASLVESVEDDIDDYHNSLLHIKFVVPRSRAKSTHE